MSYLCMHQPPHHAVYCRGFVNFVLWFQTMSCTGSHGLLHTSLNECDTNASHNFVLLIRLPIEYPWESTEVMTSQKTFYAFHRFEYIGGA